jgi:glucuronate isomerase
MNQSFIDDNFLLKTGSARQLYHRHSASLPIIDYHNHLPPQQIAEDCNYKNLTAIWLHGDHYKWRAMRANGIAEKYITGNGSDEEKFVCWAATVPYTMRNPLYHWTHLELQRYFNISDLLDEKNALEVYAHCNALLQTKAYSVRNLLTKMNVEVICTTDDPCDDLQYHKKIRNEGFSIKVLPTFRPDAAIAIEESRKWNDWINKLQDVSGITVRNYSGFLDAIKKRHDFFAEQGCLLSDHGVETLYAADYDKKNMDRLFADLRNGTALCSGKSREFKSAVLYDLALLDHEKKWTAQWHIGAMRNNNTALLHQSGVDTGVDSIGDFSNAREMSRFFDKLNTTQQLSKTIVYNLNPADNEVYATMMGNFQDSTMPAKMQWGSAWWFLDQKDGMEKQINTLSNMGLLSRFIGMLTDSRSFLSFPRHEYFRRILCNIIGNDIENGELPNEPLLIGKIIEDICYYNAKHYFGF